MLTPRGDVASTITIPTRGAAAGLDSYTHYTEYGEPLTTQPTGNAGAAAAGYGWLGAHQCTTTTIGILLMGARLYNPTTGLFTSIDPVWGGNETVYGYPNDPINGNDTTGEGRRWNAFKKGVTSLASNRVVRGVCFVAFGPVGTACAVLSAASNLVNRNWAGLAGDAVGAVGGRVAGRVFTKVFNKAQNFYQRKSRHMYRSGNGRVRKAARSRPSAARVFNSRRRYVGYEASFWAGGTLGSAGGEWLAKRPYRRIKK